MAFGRRNIFVVSKSVFVLLPISCCTGDPIYLVINWRVTQS